MVDESSLDSYIMRLWKSWRDFSKAGRLANRVCWLISWWRHLSCHIPRTWRSNTRECATLQLLHLDHSLRDPQMICSRPMSSMSPPEKFKSTRPLNQSMISTRQWSAEESWSSAYWRWANFWTFTYFTPAHKQMISRLECMVLFQNLTQSINRHLSFECFLSASSLSISLFEVHDGVRVRR